VIHLWYPLGTDYDGQYTSFGNMLKSASASATIGKTACFLLAGSDGQGNLYQTQEDNCQSIKPTVCRKNLGMSYTKLSQFCNFLFSF
jgi:hypothetical protein